jgi:hypothetical protein
MPLTLWFWAAHLVTVHTPGLSALQRQRQLGLDSYETAWAMLHKLRRAMVRPDREALKEKVEVDEVCVGGAEAGLTVDWPRGTGNRREEGDNGRADRLVPRQPARRRRSKDADKRESIMMKAEDKTEMKSEEKIAEKAPYENPSHCLICGQVGQPSCMGIGFVITART